jgi:hypothetical protein
LDPQQLVPRAGTLPGISAAVVTGAGCLLLDAATQTTSLCRCDDHGICPVALIRPPPCLN